MHRVATGLPRCAKALHQGCGHDSVTVDVVLVCDCPSSRRGGAGSWPGWRPAHPGGNGGHGS
eukprot:366417-Chlamydomonas_euryale.AAC.15